MAEEVKPKSSMKAKSTMKFAMKAKSSMKVMKASMKAIKATLPDLVESCLSLTVTLAVYRDLK